MTSPPPLRTPLCDLLGVELPLVHAPIGSATSVGLASAVCEAGGLGTVAMSWRDEQQIRDLLRRLAACLEEGSPIVSLFWGDPSL